jgi:[acyl-carrier-protein] S-malonyltransferase
VGKLAFFFAGQGAQYPGMGASICEVSPAARAVFEAADRIRPGTSKQCFNGSAEELNQTINTQPCLFTVDVACAQALCEAGVWPSMAAGFSLGELAAVDFCGLLPFEQTLRLVMKRAQLMQRCTEQYSGGMLAVLRLDATQVEELCEPLTSVWPVNYNAPGQTVVAGSTEALAKLETAVKEAGGRAMRLPVSGAFHSPFMNEAAEGLRAYLHALHNPEAAEPHIPLYANATAEPYCRVEPLADQLAEQLRSPVLFERSVEHMLAAGTTVCVEVGAGTTLSGLIKKIDAGVERYNVQDAASLHDTVAHLKEGGWC